MGVLEDVMSRLGGNGGLPDASCTEVTWACVCNRERWWSVLFRVDNRHSNVIKFCEPGLKFLALAVRDSVITGACRMATVGKCLRHIT